MATRGRQLGSKSKIPRGAGKANLWNLGIAIDSKAGSKRVGATMELAFDNFDENLQSGFDKLVLLWTEKVFSKSIGGAVRATTWVRSGMLEKTVAKLRQLPKQTPDGRQYVIGADFPSDATEYQGIALEMGRESGRAPKNKYYLVPLATWVMKKGRVGKERRYMTSAEIRRDLAQPGAFMAKQTFTTSSGAEARMIFLMHKNRRRFAKNKKTGRFTKLGKKSKLSEVATAMYLALNGATGIYGKSSEFRKKAKRNMSPLAAQFGLTTTRNAPKWFSHAAGNALERLYKAIMNVKGRAEATGLVQRETKEMSQEGGINLDQLITQGTDRVLEDIVQEMREMGLSEADIRYWTAE